MSNITHFYKSIFFGVVAVAFLLLTVSFFLPLTVHAAPQQLHGWAWSSNIGWIGFNCADVSACATANYKVTFDDVSGDLSGYAWSSSIGWVWFDIAAAGCPNGTCPAKVNMSGGRWLDRTFRHKSHIPECRGCWWCYLSRRAFQVCWLCVGG